mmetsp:Transcript_7437/g.19072  ORF Transcript_7437/g.19072 Transcript_7437/m.19072 type:complete len:220 (-) Transcript_7437:169-828(-)
MSSPNLHKHRQAVGWPVGAISAPLGNINQSLLLCTGFQNTRNIRTDHNLSQAWQLLTRLEVCTQAKRHPALQHTNSARHRARLEVALGSRSTAPLTCWRVGQTRDETATPTVVSQPRSRSALTVARRGHAELTHLHAHLHLAGERPRLAATSLAQPMSRALREDKCAETATNGRAAAPQLPARTCRRCCSFGRPSPNTAAEAQRAARFPRRSRSPRGTE